MATKITKDTITVPYESLIGKGVIKPVLNEQTQNQIEAAIANFTGATRWKAWGMGSLQKQGSLVLLHGPSGTGKTTIARWLAKQVGTGFIPLSMADVGGSDPGQTERNLRTVFNKGRKEDNTTIFLDECDGILWSREKAGPDSMWMLSVINGLLTMVEPYQGLVVMATNMMQNLDPALMRRLTDIIEVARPNMDTRYNLWIDKIPAQFPVQPNETEFAKLAMYHLSGAEIENAIMAEAKLAITLGRKPKFESLCNIANRMQPHDSKTTTSKVIGDSKK